MAEYSKVVITEKGQSLLAKMLAGEVSEVEFTYIRASSAVYEVDDLVSLEELTNIEQIGVISAITRTNEVAVQVETYFTNTDLTEGYNMRTLGLYAADPDEGEILYAATVETSGNCYMPAYNGITVSGAYIKIITTVGNADSISLDVSPAAIATIGDLEKLTANVESRLTELVNAMLKVSYNEDEELVFEQADFETFDTSTSDYTLPVATATTLGGVMIGDGITVDDNGMISVDLSTLSDDSEAAAAVVDAGTEVMSEEEVSDAYSDAASETDD